MTVAKVWDGAAWRAIAGGVSNAAWDAVDAKLTQDEFTIDSLDSDIVAVGPVTGNGINVGTSPTALPGLALSYTTRNENMQGRVCATCRMQTNQATWNYNWIGLSISPAPVLRMAPSHTGLSLMANVSPQPLYHHATIWDYVQLAPNTAYTFQVTSFCGLANLFQWGLNSPENWILGEFWGR